MGSGASQREYSVSESPLSSQPNTEMEAVQTSERKPLIVITAPSRDDIYATPSNITIAEALKERRPGSTPFVVGKKQIARR
ncbi:hypothetical protein OJAV_G00060700 [Oryzias javanicus]|uniref:Uncharacterized protein n=1 Tax=Oryzias javanicus TaxID=123683 RepID=A0A3S2PD17_ORYJA|nr:hypothetical protein OJAV_G00060700 [Oryzias javanicus]